MNTTTTTAPDERGIHDRYARYVARTGGVWDEEDYGTYRSWFLSRRDTDAHVDAGVDARAEKCNAVLASHGLEVRRTGCGWSLFRGDVRLSPLGRTMNETWRRARRELLDEGMRRAARSLLGYADGCHARIRPDVAILLAKKLAPVTRLAARMDRTPNAWEWRLAEAMQDVVRLHDVPDASFEYAIQRARARARHASA